jgi:CHAT domain-containing protein
MTRSSLRWNHFAPGRTLVIEAEGWLARVPFEALLDANDHYLIERASMVHSLGRIRRRGCTTTPAFQRDLPALVVGSTASSAADGLIPLPDVAAEADAVASGFHSVRVLKGGEATLSAVRSELPGAAVFHFAGHSLAAPQRTGLLLQGGAGQANTPRLMDAERCAAASPAELAAGGALSVQYCDRQCRLQRIRQRYGCLPACGCTPRGREPVGRGLGNPRIRSRTFISNALSGQSVSDAIRLTSRNLLANPRTSHPYYWSAFAAYGQP